MVTWSAATGLVRHRFARGRTQRASAAAHAVAGRAAETAADVEVTSRPTTVDSNKFEHGCGRIHAGLHSFFGLGLEDGHVPNFWILL